MSTLAMAQSYPGYRLHSKPSVRLERRQQRGSSAKAPGLENVDNLATPGTTRGPTVRYDRGVQRRRSHVSESCKEQSKSHSEWLSHTRRTTYATACGSTTNW